MVCSELEEMYHNLVLKCHLFDQKKEYILNHPELKLTASLETLESVIEKSVGNQKTLFRLHRNLLIEVLSRGVDEAFCDYDYVDSDTSQLFFQYVTDSNVGISASSIVTQNNLCKLDDSTKIKLINWFIAGYPDSESRIPYIKACIGLDSGRNS